MQTNFTELPNIIIMNGIVPVQNMLHNCKLAWQDN